jgi:hypothetical protein
MNYIYKKREWISAFQLAEYPRETPPLERGITALAAPSPRRIDRASAAETQVRRPFLKVPSTAKPAVTAFIGGLPRTVRRWLAVKPIAARAHLISGGWVRTTVVGAHPTDARFH